MKILLVNEEGCFAPGIIALAKALSVSHRVVIVGPLSPLCGTGHTFTNGNAPIQVRQYFTQLSKVKIFAVSGTPCDCVTLALDKLLKSKPDLIISGIDGNKTRPLIERPLQMHWWVIGMSITDKVYTPDKLILETEIVPTDAAMKKGIIGAVKANAKHGVSCRETPEGTLVIKW